MAPIAEGLDLPSGSECLYSLDQKYYSFQLSFEDIFMEVDIRSTGMIELAQSMAQLLLTRLEFLF